MGTSKAALTFQASSWWSSTLGIACSSHHQTAMSMHWPCHSIHLQWSSRGGLGCRSCQRSLLPSPPCQARCPPKKYLRSGSREDGEPKVPFCWLTPVGHLLSLGQGGNLPHWGIPPVLCSSKVTHLLSLEGLGEGAHLFAESPVWPDTEVTCSWWPVGGCLLWLLVHPLLCKCWWLPNCPWLLDHQWEMEWLSLSMWPSNRVACHQCPALDIQSHPQGLLTWLLPPTLEMVISHLHPTLELRPVVWHGSASWSSPWFFLLGGTLPTPEVLL